MPISSCSDGDKPGYKWGDGGKCYLYTAGDQKSMEAAKMKAQMQGVAARANGYEEKANEVTTSSMGSGIKNPQRGYGSKKKKKLIDDIEKNEEMINGYPAATQDITVNIKNRQYCIDVANYGPMNPAISNPEFWQQKADIFKTTPEEAKTALCGNCAAFIQTTDMRTAIAAGLGGEDEAYAVINLANLGYCEIFDFKCAASRTCDAWVVGGPVNDSNADMSKTYVNVRKIQYMNPLS
jgi:hypothetical protein